MPLWKNELTLQRNIFNLLCCLLIISVFFNNLLHLRHFGTKLQLTEICFLLTVPFVPYKQLTTYQLKNHRRFIAIACIYLVFDLTSSFLSHRTSSIMESFGRCYLLCLFAIFSFYLSQFDLRAMIAKLDKVFLLSAIFIIIISALAYILIFSTGNAMFIYPAPDYPYLGMTYRLRGPTILPSMLISILTFLTLFIAGTAGRVKNKAFAKTIFYLLCACAVLTFSKSFVMLFTCLVVLRAMKVWRVPKALLVTVCICVTAVMVFFTHVIVLNENSPQLKTLATSNYSSGRVVFRAGNYAGIESNYLAIKIAELRVMKDHIWFGVGTGNFNDEIRRLKGEGLFTRTLPNSDPHSTFMGALVENGIFAAFMLLILFGYVFKQFVIRKDLITDTFIFILFMIFITMLVDSIYTDTLNFRHIWLFFAIALTYFIKKDDRELLSN